MINKRYILGKKLGQGRSKVFNVIDTEFPEREVAAKFLPVASSDEEKKSFRDEFFTLQKLDHPNIIKSFEISAVLTEDDEDSEIEKFSQFITLEHFASSELLQYKGIRDERKLTLVVKQICSVLYYLHQSNYIYYDLKPENILVEEINGDPFIKIIDLGLSQYILKDYEQSVKGTAYYIAPELLKNEIHDYTVDFYSLGMILYRVIYDRFPFESDNQLEIYKSQIEDEFLFPESDYSEKIISVIKKLIKKNPVERYNNALQIIADLGLPIDINLVKDLIPAKVFSDRKDAYNILTTYLKDFKSNEVFTVRGFDGSGKSSLLLEINEKNPSSILVENTKTKTGIEAIRYIFRKIILSEILFSEISKNFEEILSRLFENDNNSFIDNIKQILNNLSEGINLIILLDDFNLYDDFTREVLSEIIPILQIKRVKVVLSESSDFDHSASTLSNLCDIQLSQFTDHQLSEFLDLSYSQNFPKRELKKFILLYADLLPGNIKQFIKDLIILKVMQYGADNVSFSADENIVLALQSSHEEMYRLRLSNLNVSELKLAQIISSFEISVEQTILAALLDVPQFDLKTILNELEKKNIISSLNVSNAPQVNSFGFKRYIYSTISNKIKFHVVLANSIKRLFPDFNTVELARQFELANEYERSVEVVKKEIDRAETISAYNYKRTLLEKLLKLPLTLLITNQLTIDLVKTLYKLSDYKSALDSIYKLSNDKIPESENSEINFIKGSSLIGLRKIEEGKKTLELLRSNIKDKVLEQKILVELAYAEFDLNNFESAEELCSQIMKSENVLAEDKGKCFNLLGLIEFQYKNNSKNALTYFNETLKYYELANLQDKLAKIQTNLGSIYYLLGNQDASKQSWNKAIEINKNIGNLEQEGVILINYGVFYQDNLQFEEAIRYWSKAVTIYSALGRQNLMALAISNMSEVYIQTCEYQIAYDNLVRVCKIFSEQKIRDDELFCLLLMGKFWFIIGNNDELEKIISRYEYLLYTEENISEGFKLNFDFLKLLAKVLDIKAFPNTSEYLNLSEKCKELGEFNLYVEILFIYLESLINVQSYEEALKILSDKELERQTSKNIFFKAQKEYYFGKIAQSTKNENLKSPIEYFETAYSFIEELSITELTWKILFAMTEIFWERGNMHKAKKPRLYAIELLNMITDHISNNKIRNSYIDRADRKKAFEKLKLMSEQTQLNEYQKS